MEQKNSVDEFFEKLPVEDKEDANIFDEIPKEGGTVAKPQEQTQKEEDNVDPEKVPESIKDRRHRRLEQRLQTERESNIALNARLQALSEMDKFAKDNEGEVNPEIAKMFDSSELGKENAIRLSHALKSVKEEAKLEALREIEEQQTKLQEEERQISDMLDNEFEAIEDTYNVDITSNSPKANKMRREFIEMIEQLSPKDEEGNIKEYADFDSVFRTYQKSRTEDKPDNTRQKEIASRSMQRGGQAQGTTTQISRGWDGWKKDYNL